jgi:hypothetical protein
MIIAGYENEPFAHMIPAQQLFSDIKISLSPPSQQQDRWDTWRRWLALPFLFIIAAFICLVCSTHKNPVRV